MAMSSRSTHTCVVGSGTRVSGTLSGEEDLLVVGRIEGSVSLQGELTVAQEGEIEANIEVDRAVISGSVSGDIAARESVVLESGSRVEGKVSAPSLIIAEGAEIEGRVDMQVDLPDGLLAATRA